MIINAIPVSDGIETNAYFYIDETTKHGFLIDAGAEPEKLQKIIEKNNWTIEKILITHGHFDHIGAVQELHKRLNIPYYGHTESQLYFTDPNYNLSSYFGQPISLTEAGYFKESDIISLDSNSEIQLKVIYTPGHTQDSAIFYDEKNNIAFVGDTIFKNSVGRTDFPGGNAQQLKASIQNKIFTLPDKTILYSGHSAPTSVANEKPNLKFFF